MNDMQRRKYPDAVIVDPKADLSELGPVIPASPAAQVIYIDPLAEFRPRSTPAPEPAGVEYHGDNASVWDRMRGDVMGRLSQKEYDR